MLPALMLEGIGYRAWGRLFLILVDEGFSLMTERGEILATASELPAVLDAICDGGTGRTRRASPLLANRRRLQEASPGFVF